MGAKRLILAAVVFIALGMTMIGCGGKSALTDESGAPLTAYLKNNIHYQDRLDRGGKTVSKASYANYVDPGQGHQILPVNTRVTIGSWRGGFTMTRVSEPKLIYFEYNKRNMTLDIRSYLNLITSSEPASLFGMSSADMKGIKEGKATPGMTRDGVRIALGYPAPHRTPSLDNTVWTYWRNRWVMMTVEFDDNGRVVKIQ